MTICLKNHDLLGDTHLRSHQLKNATCQAVNIFKMHTLEDSVEKYPQ